jgi:hypothetical protein
MRALLLFGFLTVFFSCKQPVKKDLLYGKWILAHVVNTSKTEKLHSIVNFYEGDSLSIEFIWNDSLTEKLIGEYQLNEDSNRLYTKVDTLPSTRWEVLKLTKTTLEMRRVGTKDINKYNRIQ